MTVVTLALSICF